MREEKRDEGSFFYFYAKFNGFLFKGKRICVPMSSLRQLIVRDEYHRGVMGLFGIEKTRGILEEKL